MSNSPGAVLFDFGNTLFAHDPLPDTIMAAAQGLGRDVEAGWAAALADRIDRAAHTAEELTHPRDLDQRIWGERWRVLYGLGDGDVPGLGDEVYRLMHDPACWLPYAGTMAVLGSLSAAGIPVGVISNTGWDVRSVFGHYGLAGAVATFVLSFEVGAVKPSARIFATACERLGVQAPEVLMVGDDPIADAGAVRAGIRTLLLPAAMPAADNGVAAVIGLIADR